VDQLALPFHFGTEGSVRRDATNNLLAISGEPSVTIMEAKAAVCSSIPSRLLRRPKFEEWIKK
jgi:hypothetical protein